MRVICSIESFSKLYTYRFELPSLEDVKTNFLPSGENAGEPVMPSPNRIFCSIQSSTPEQISPTDHPRKKRRLDRRLRVTKPAREAAGQI